MTNTFKFHVKHGSDPFRKGTGRVHIDEDETIRFELPVKADQVQTSPKIRNVMLCDKSISPKLAFRAWTLPTLELDFSRLPMFLAFLLLTLILPVPAALAWEWIFKGLAIAGCFFYILVLPLGRILIEFEDDSYVCGELAQRVLDEHYIHILG